MHSDDETRKDSNRSEPIKRNMFRDMAQTPLILITERLDAQCAKWLEQHGDVRWPGKDGEAPLEALLPEADALVVRTYTQINDALLDVAPKLRVIGRAGVGLDNFDLNACERRGVTVVYTPDANTQAVVEYVTGLMLDAVRPRHVMRQPVSSDTFHALRSEHVGRQLDQLTLGILGFGRIGKRLGKVATSLGMRVCVNDLISEGELREAVDYSFEYVTKAQLYEGSDILSIHVDGRPENNNLIAGDALQQVKPGVLLINSSRGNVIDPVALADWAKTRAAAESDQPIKSRAVLDVHQPEPPADDYPLWNLDNVSLLPHLASRTDTALANMSWVVRVMWWRC